MHNAYDPSAVEYTALAELCGLDAALSFGSSCFNAHAQCLDCMCRLLCDELCLCQVHKAHHCSSEQTHVLQLGAAHHRAKRLWHRTPLAACLAASVA